MSNISCQTVFVADIPFRFTVKMDREYPRK
jgi:hypothetical protein